MTVIIGRGELPPWRTGPASNRTRQQVLNRAARASQQTINVAAANQIIPIVYGRQRIDAHFHVIGTYQLSFLNLLLGCAWCQGEIEEIESIYLDGLTPAEWVAEGRRTPGRFNPSNQATDSVNIDGIESFIGTQTQGVPFTFTRGGGNPSLFDFGGGPSPYTDTNAGISYSCIELDPRDELTRLPRMEAVIRGLKIYDPRDVAQTEGDATTYTWSPNWALILADFIDRFSTFNVDWSSVSAAADWASEIVTTGTQANQTQTDNYDNSVRRLGGLAITQPVPVDDMIQTMAEYAGCFAVQNNGQYTLIPDRPGSPVHFFRDVTDGSDTANIVKDSMRIRRSDQRSKPTVVRVDYTQPDDNGWRRETAETDTPPSGIVRRLGLSMPGFLNMATARRHAVERLNKINLTDINISFETQDAGLRVTRGDIIEVTHRYGLTDTQFRVVDVSNIEPGRWRIDALKYDPVVYSDEIEPDPVYGNGGVAGLFVGSPLFTVPISLKWVLGDNGVAQQRYSISFFDEAFGLIDALKVFKIEAYDTASPEDIIWQDSVPYGNTLVDENFASNRQIIGPTLGDIVANPVNSYRFRIKTEYVGYASSFSESGLLPVTDLYPDSSAPIVFNQVADTLNFSWSPAMPFDGVLYQVRAVRESDATGLGNTPTPSDPHVVLSSDLSITEVSADTSGLIDGEPYFFMVRSRRSDIPSQSGYNDPSAALDFVGPFTISTNNLPTTNLKDVSSVAPVNGQSLVFDSVSGEYAPGTVGPQIVFKDTNTNITTAYASDPDLSLPLQADSRYSIELILQITSTFAAITDLAIQFSVPAGAAYRIQSVDKGADQASSSSIDLDASSASDTALYKVYGYIETSSTAGDITLQHKGDVSIGILRAEENSHMIVTKLD